MGSLHRQGLLNLYIVYSAWHFMAGARGYTPVASGRQKHTQHTQHTTHNTHTTHTHTTHTQHTTLHTTLHTTDLCANLGETKDVIEEEATCARMLGSPPLGDDTHGG